MNWAYPLVFSIGLTTEWLWVIAVDAVAKMRVWTVVFTAVAIPGINLLGIGEYVDDRALALPMLSGHAAGALGVMLWKVWLASGRGRPTTGPGSQSSDPS